MKHPLVSRLYDRSRNLPARVFRQAPIKREKEGSGIAIVAAIREYLADILGAFIPGVYFSIHLVVSAALFLVIANVCSWGKIAGLAGQSTPFMVFLFCLFSYIMGSVFCRKDIKEPDMASAIRTYWKTDPADRNGLDFGEKPDRGEKTGGNKQPWKLFRTVAGVFKKRKFLVDFPYLHLKRYLQYRNYTRLAERIPWDGYNEATFTLRSKTFINRLKCRIHLFASEEMLEIEKNEAHIRLMNSLWYAAKSIRNISIVTFLLVVVFYINHNLGAAADNPVFYMFSLVWSFIHRGRETPDLARFPVFFLVVQYGIAAYIRRSIKQYFHYMRVREIVFILEIADTIGRVTGINMFKELGQDKASGQPAPANKGARS